MKPRIPIRIVAVNTAAFAFAFAAWVMLGPSSREIAKELGLGPSGAALLKAVPILTGAVLRIPAGALADRLGARVAFPTVLVIGAIAAALLGSTSTLAMAVTLGLALGAVGSSFAVGVQSVAAWTPAERRGLAMGTFGAGNIGTAITTFGMPLLLASLGWRGTFRVYAVGLLVVAIAYAALVPRAPASAPVRLGVALRPLASRGAWYIGFLYMATFGVFVAMTLTLGDLYIDRYKLSARSAGLLVTTFTFSASLVRILGGWLSDRFGAARVTRVALPVVALGLSTVALHLPLAVVVGGVFVGGIAGGIGNASIMKLVPERFPESVGTTSGIVGALGGLAGFFLPLLGAWVGQAFAPSLALVLAAGATYFLAERSRPVAAVIPLPLPKPKSDRKAA